MNKRNPKVGKRLFKLDTKTATAIAKAIIFLIYISLKHTPKLIKATTELK